MNGVNKQMEVHMVAQAHGIHPPEEGFPRAAATRAALATATDVNIHLHIWAAIECMLLGHGP